MPSVALLYTSPGLIYYQPLQSTAVRMALEAGVLKAICDSDSTSISALNLSKVTGYDALLISTDSYMLDSDIVR